MGAINYLTKLVTELKNWRASLSSSVGLVFAKILWGAISKGENAIFLGQVCTFFSAKLRIIFGLRYFDQEEFAQMCAFDVYYIVFN